MPLQKGSFAKELKAFIIIPNKIKQKDARSGYYAGNTKTITNVLSNNFREPYSPVKIFQYSK